MPQRTLQKRIFLHFFISLSISYYLFLIFYFFIYLFLYLGHFFITLIKKIELVTRLVEFVLKMV